MKIIVSYPPLSTAKGCPTLGQNRQFQYFSSPTFIYPVVPALAATMLQAAGHEVIWNDCLAEGLGREEYFQFLLREQPDLLVFETKTPVIGEHWNFIDEIGKLPFALRPPKTVLVGDHVTALPEESFRRSAVDYVLAGGDYDFLLKNLCDQLSRLVPDSPEIVAASLESGIWYRTKEGIKNTGPFRLDHDLDILPFIDRTLTRWELYAYKNGNYRSVPGTYLMSGRDCWWGKCSFCSWTGLYPRFRVRRVENVMAELEDLSARLKVREVMDDTGTFPAGDWLRDFCRARIESGQHRRLPLDCNFRLGAAGEEDYRLMKKAGFRLLLFGVESANRKTLDRLRKGLSADLIVESCRLARAAGLYPHITLMFGYPWESWEEARNTYRLGAYLLKRGYAYTMQSTLVVPYPGTDLYQECLDNDWLTTREWSDFDMKRPVMKIPFPEERLLELIRSMYALAFHPRFLLGRILGIRRWDDLKYFLRAGRKVFGHLKDFTGRGKGS